MYAYVDELMSTGNDKDYWNNIKEDKADKSLAVCQQDMLLNYLPNCARILLFYQLCKTHTFSFSTQNTHTLNTYAFMKIP